jgi:hypothetical protein
MRVECNYCGEAAERVTGAQMYPHLPALRARIFFRCLPCRAHVGTHAATGKPFGRLANAELRAARRRAHDAFDALWRRKRSSRSNAYAWLARELGIRVEETHIGMFDVAMCERVVDVCKGQSRIERG